MYFVQTYLLGNTPGPLKKFREEEFDNLREYSDIRELKECDKVYNYACYNNLGNLDKSSKYVCPIRQHI